LVETITLILRQNGRFLFERGFEPKMMKLKLISFFLLIVFSSLIAACSAASERAAAPEPPVMAMPTALAEQESAAGAPASEFSDGIAVPLEDFLASAVQAQEARVIIYTGNISLVVQETQQAVNAITALVNEQGGYVAGSNIYRSNNVLRGNITVRIPAERYQEVLASLRELAIRVESENSNTQDVTEEFTDLQARKTNLELTEKSLQELLDERRRSGSTSDILEVYRELTNIRGQIEQIEGRLRYLANQSALSTITIELVPDVLYQPVSVAGWEPQGVAKEALQALVAALQVLVNLLIWLAIFVLPLLLILLIPVALLVLFIRWWWKRRKARRQTPLPPPPVATSS
jgi:hypothetical protein